MRERERRGGRSAMEVVVMAVVVVVMVVTGGVKDTAATPALTTMHQHHHHNQEPVGPTSMKANHVEDAYLDDALDDWLNNFETYTFMVKQDLDSHDDEVAEGGQEEGVDAGTIEEQEMVEEEHQERTEEWSAPIAVSVGSKSLLDPHLDYIVTVESLVAEEGSIFLTLSKYNNQTGCGVGGFTVEAAMRSPPPRGPVARGGSSNVGGGGIEEQRNASTTFIAFDLQHEGNLSLPDTSAWAEVSEDYWWARGRLAGGGMLSITFTPPECGCLALSTYYALPVGNLTLVVGPQAYPDELQALLCIDPLALAPAQEEYDEEEEAAAAEDVGEYLQEPSALVAPRTTDASETEAEQEAETSPEEQPTVVTPRRRKGSRGERRKVKKNRRQMKRQRIRQAGRRQARRQQRQQQRLEEEEVAGEEGAAPDVTRPGRRRWKQRRRGKNVWRKIKRGRKGRRRIHGAKHPHFHHEEDGNGTSSENITDHHPHHPHPFHGHNNTAATQQEERLIDILLRDVHTENSTATEEEEDAPAGEGSVNGEAAVGAEGQEGEADDAAAMTPRQRRKNRRQRKKMMRKERKKVHPPGVKFCCKQGVKHKKNILEFNSTSEGSPAPCNSTSEVVSTFANHQFGIEVDTCDHTYTKCCTGFTAEMWNSIKAKKMARRMERKQRRKSRRQGRKHRRLNERRMRKEMKKQSRHPDEAEEDAEAGVEEQAEGEAVVQ